MEHLPVELKMLISLHLRPTETSALARTCKAFSFLRKDVGFAVLHLQHHRSDFLVSASKLPLNYVSARIVILQSFSTLARFHLTSPAKRDFAFPILKRLKEYPHLFDLMNAEEGYVLKWACSWGKEDVVRMLLLDEPPTIYDYNVVKEALHISMQFGRGDVAQLIATLV